MDNDNKQNKTSHYEYNFDNNTAVYVDNEKEYTHPANAVATHPDGATHPLSPANAGATHPDGATHHLPPANAVATHHDGATHLPPANAVDTPPDGATPLPHANATPSAKDKYIIKLYNEGNNDNDGNGGNNDNDGNEDIKLILTHNDSIITLLNIWPPVRQEENKEEEEKEKYKLYNFSHYAYNSEYIFIYETELSNNNIFNIFIYLLSHFICKNITEGKKTITYDNLKKNFDISYKEFIEYNKSTGDKLFFPTIINKHYFNEGFLDIFSKLIKKPKTEKKIGGGNGGSGGNGGNGGSGGSGGSGAVIMRNVRGRGRGRFGDLCQTSNGLLSLCSDPPSYFSGTTPAFPTSIDPSSNKFKSTRNSESATISSDDFMNWIKEWGNEINITPKSFIDIFDENYRDIFKNKIINILNGNTTDGKGTKGLSTHSKIVEDKEIYNIKPKTEGNCIASSTQVLQCIWFNKEAHSNQTCGCSGSIRKDGDPNNSKSNNLLKNIEKEMIKNEMIKKSSLLLWTIYIITIPTSAPVTAAPVTTKPIEIFNIFKTVLGKDTFFINNPKQVTDIINKFLEKYKDKSEEEVRSIIQKLFNETEQASKGEEVTNTNPDNSLRGGFYKMDNVEKSVKQNKIKLTENKKIKLKKLLEIRNIYTNKEKYYKNKKIKKNKFNENIIFFKNRNKLTITFTNYIFEKFLIPIKHFNIYMKKNKKIDIIEKNLKDFENKYDLQKVTRDNNEKLMEFFLKKKNLEKEKNNKKKRKEKNKKEPNEFINQELNLLNEKKTQILELEEKSIRENPEIKEYYLEKMNYNKNIKIIQNHYDKLQERIKKYKSYYKIIENKKKKFYTINNLNITYLQYIKNEIEIFNLFNIELDTKMKKEFKKNIKNTYIFYYILKKKFTTFLTKLNKKKFIINEEFKNLYSEKNNLNKKFDKSVYVKDKEEILELLRKINVKIYYFKLIYYNLNLIIELIEDINIKSEYMLFIIEYFLSYLNNYETVCNILNLIVDKDILYQYLEKDTMELNKITKKNISYKDFLKILNNIKNNNKYIYNNRKRLLGKKNTINTKYHTIIEETFNLENDIKKKVVIKNEEKYEMEKQEKIKELREKEREKLKYEDFINNLINLNADYLLILNPILLLVKVEYLNFNNNKLTINKKTLNKIPNNKTIKKKLKRLNILENKINVFNESNNIKPFVIKYPQNPLN